MTIFSSEAQDRHSFDKYHSPEEVGTRLESLANANPHLTKLTVLGQSGGERNLYLLRIAAQPEGSVQPDSRPAVFVSANIEGPHLVGTEAALLLIEKLITGYGSDDRMTSLLENKTVYVAPLLNPDGASKYFRSPQFECYTNDSPKDEDADGLTDEDGPEDLDRDGFITQMRIKDPHGEWTPDPDEPRLMQRADPQKGESGIYRIITEGLDNDKDGQYNEDPPGGIELNRHFPHILEHNLNKTDRWVDPAPETIAMIKFLTDHPNVTMVLNFSRENTLTNIEQTGRVNEKTDKMKLPNNITDMLELNPDSVYTLRDLQDIFQEKNILPPGLQINEYEIARFLGLDLSLSIDEEDMGFFRTVQQDYREKMKAAGLQYSDIKTHGLDKGSFIGFCYFRYGVPVFSASLWTVPEHADIPLKEKGLTEWKPYKHPTLGHVEIGGTLPFRRINPRPEDMATTLHFHADYYIHLITHIAELKIRDIRVTPLGDSISRVTVTFANTGWFPTCTAQGRKSHTSWPITVRLKTTKEQMIYAGEPFEIIPFIDGGKTRQMEWKIKGKRGSQVTLSATSFKVGTVKTVFELR